MSKLYIICGNCGANEGLGFYIKPGAIDDGDGNISADTFINCSNCSTLHALSETANKIKEPGNKSFTGPHEFRVNDYGQIKEGDILRIVRKIESFNETTKAQEVINKKTKREEVLLDIKRNHYFSVGMYLDGTGWARDIYIVKG
jgi:hypothetical protein